MPQVSKSENLREVGNKIRYYREKKKMSQLERKRQTMRQSLKSTPPIIGDVASCIRPEDYLTMA